MKYWKGIAGTTKEGQCGTMDDTGFVPDTVEATAGEYLIYVTNQPPAPANPYTALYNAAATDNERITVLAKAMRLIP